MPEVSSSPTWHDILLELVRSVRRRVRPLLEQRRHVPMERLKHLLDDSAQQAIVETLELSEVSARLISEEGDRIFGPGEYAVIADPVDGTTNLVRGLIPSVVSVSVGLESMQSSVFAGVVASIESDEVFFAERGRGATLNGEAISPAQPVSLRDSLLSVDISKVEDPTVFGPLIGISRHIRSGGCSAMGLCQVASGTVDAHVDHRALIRATDISAGLFILKEAGAVYSIDGRIGGDFPLTRNTRVSVVAASNKNLLLAIRSLFHGAEG